MNPTLNYMNTLENNFFISIILPFYRIVMFYMVFLCCAYVFTLFIY